MLNFIIYPDSVLHIFGWDYLIKDTIYRVFAVSKKKNPGRLHKALTF